MATKKTATKKAAAPKKAASPKNAAAPVQKTVPAVKKDDTVTYVDKAGNENKARVLAVHGGNRLDLVVSGATPFSAPEVIHESDSVYRPGGTPYWK